MHANQKRTLALLLAVMLVGAGCQTSGQTGALAGAGIGALAGQAIGGDTEATLVGAAVGAGIGYLIGNEKDKQKAGQMSAEREAQNYDHDEVGPLGGTRWTVVSLSPKDRFPPVKSHVVEFDTKGHVTTTRTLEDGTVETETENYRVVGQTLVVNKPGYLVNARFAIERDLLILDADDFHAVLKRL